MPFIDESFDVVFCRSSLHHFADPELAVAEMARVCRTSGRVVLVDLLAPDDERRDRFDHVHRLLDPSHVRTYTEPELAGMLPGGAAGVSYRSTMSGRLPIDVIITEQSDRDAVLAALRAELSGAGADRVRPGRGRRADRRLLRDRDLARRARGACAS